MIQTFWGSATVRPWLEWTVRAYPRAQSWPHLPSRTSRAYFKGTSTTFRTSSASLAYHPARAQGWWPWCFAAECLWGGIAEVRGRPGNTSHGARTAASGPGREPSSSRSRWDYMASRPPRSAPTRGNQEAPFVPLGTGPYRAEGGFASWGPWEGGLWLCGLPRPLRNRRHARGASRVAFLRRLGAAAPGRHSRWPGRPVPRASGGRFPEWGGALCRPRPRWSHGERISVPSFRASSPFGRSSVRSCDRSGHGRPWLASLWPGDGSGWRRGGFWYGRARSLAWFCRCPRRRLGNSARGSSWRGAVLEVRSLFVAL